MSLIRSCFFCKESGNIEKTKPHFFTIKIISQFFPSSGSEIELGIRVFVTSSWNAKNNETDHKNNFFFAKKQWNRSSKRKVDEFSSQAQKQKNLPFRCSLLNKIVFQSFTFSYVIKCQYRVCKKNNFYFQNMLNRWTKYWVKLRSTIPKLGRSLFQLQKLLLRKYNRKEK